MTIGERIQKLMVDAGYNQKSLAEACGFGETAIRDLITGKAQEPKSSRLYKIAEVFGVSMEMILGMPELDKNQSQKSDSEQSAYGTTHSSKINDSMVKTHLPSERITHTVPALGKVEAGAWREMIEEYPGEDTEFVQCELPEYRGVEAYCNWVSGTSVNELVDGGGKVVWVPADEAIGGLQEGDFVMVRRPNETPGQFEITVKRLHVRDDGDWELQPASTDPKWQTSFIIPPRNEMAQEGIVVYGVVVETRPPKLRRSGIPARQKVSA